ncbi:MAG TPA: cyclic-di-AMP receptor [Anaerolineales bacterium]|nr:cyclic-di-AMP receptor [Anaerolineales bacterium]
MEASPDHSTPTLPSQSASAERIDRLMIAFIQTQDLDKAMRALNKLRFSVTQVSTTGGFLGQNNSTLLIGFPRAKESLAFEALQKSCRRRVEYAATPLEGAPYHMPLATPIPVGGATVFTFDIEHYEEIG